MKCIRSDRLCEQAQNRVAARDVYRPIHLDALEHQLTFTGRCLTILGLPVETGYSRTGWAWMTHALILTNIACFALCLFAYTPPDSHVFTQKLFGLHGGAQIWGLIPSQYIADPAGEWIKLFTSMFMHCNLLHLIGNVRMLAIVGDDVERRLGRPAYLLLYFMGGVFADYCSMFFGPAAAQSIPHVGASAAIAAVMGVYWVLMQNKRFHFRICIVLVIPVLTSLVFAVWFLTETYASVHAEGLVDHAAHLGGFLFGILIATIVALKEQCFEGEVATV